MQCMGRMVRSEHVAVLMYGFILYSYRVCGHALGSAAFKCYLKWRINNFLDFFFKSFGDTNYLHDMSPVGIFSDSPIAKVCITCSFP